MADNSAALVQATRDCVRTLRAEMRRRVLAGTLEADDVIALVDGTMARLMRCLDELARPEMGAEAFFPVVLTLLLETVEPPDHPASVMGDPN